MVRLLLRCYDRSICSALAQQRTCTVGPQLRLPLFLLGAVQLLAGCVHVAVWVGDLKRYRSLAISALDVFFWPKLQCSHEASVSMHTLGRLEKSQVNLPARATVTLCVFIRHRREAPESLLKHCVAGLRLRGRGTAQSDDGAPLAPLVAGSRRRRDGFNQTRAHPGA